MDKMGRSSDMTGIERDLADKIDELIGGYEKMKKRLDEHINLDYKIK